MNTFKCLSKALAKRPAGHQSNIPFNRHSNRPQKLAYLIEHPPQGMSTEVHSGCMYNENNVHYDEEATNRDVYGVGD